MSAINVELGNFIYKIQEKIIPLYKKINKDSVYLTADQLQERSNNESAKKIASIVAGYDKYKFGPMWCEKQGILPDGREVYLQSSTNTLEILIPATDTIPHRTHVCFNLVTEKINTYEIRRPDDQPIIFYQVNLPKSSVPITLSRSDILHDVGLILTQVERGFGTQTGL